MLAAISDQALVTINSLELLGIIYLAIAVSGLRERLARLEGMLAAERERLIRRDTDV